MPLSSDVLHHIISYLTKDQYQLLLKFRTICRDWKEVAERSLIWGECKLTIASPLKYRLTLLAFDDQTFFYDQFFELHQPITELQKAVAEVTITRNDICSRHDHALDISKHFIDKFRLCHRSWNRFLLLLSALMLVDDICKIWRNCWLHEGLFWAAMAILAFASYSTFSGSPSAILFQIEEKMSSISIILICLFLFDWTAQFMISIGTFLKYSSNMNILTPIVVTLMSPSRHEKYTITLGIVGIVISYVLQYYLPNNDVNSVDVNLIIRSVGVLSIITLIMENKFKIKNSPVYSTSIVSLYLSIIVIGFVRYYHSFGYICICLFPITFMMFIFSLLAIWSSVLLWGDWMIEDKIVFSKPNNRSTNSYNYSFFIRLVANLLITLSINLIFCILIIVLYEMNANPLSVFRTFTAVVVIAALIIVFSTASDRVVRAM